MTDYQAGERGEQNDAARTASVVLAMARARGGCTRRYFRNSRHRLPPTLCASKPGGERLRPSRLFAGRRLRAGRRGAGVTVTESYRGESHQGGLSPRGRGEAWWLSPRMSVVTVEPAPRRLRPFVFGSGAASPHLVLERKAPAGICEDLRRHHLVVRGSEVAGRCPRRSRFGLR